MFQNMTPQEKKVLKIGAGIAVVGIAAFGIKRLIEGRQGLPDDPGAGMLPAPDPGAGSGGGGAPAPTVPKASQWNVNTPICYKSPYTRMVKVLQSGINTISKKVGEPLLKVDGQFGPATLKKVHSYFNAECVTLDRLNTRLQTLRAQTPNY